MKSFALAAIAAPALVAASNVHNAFAHAHVARQDVAAAAASGASGTPSASGAPAPASGSASAATPTASVAGPPAPSSVSFSLMSVNPTAVPVGSITAGTLSDLATASFASPAAASTPSGIPNAPPLPAVDQASLPPSKYPQLDVIPPTDSPEVLQWIAEVKASGINIPGYAPTVAAGGCTGANAQAAAESDRCWWTCGGCVRETDVTTCPQKFQWGLTYDDGPSWYTPNLLSYLDQVNLKATMFVVGSRAISYPHLLQAEYMAGHQIAVHTWSHHYLTSMTNEQIIAELGWSKKVIKDVIGVTPNFMRPPFGDIDDRVRNISIAMGLTPIMWTRISATATFDTEDFTVAGGTTSVSQVLQNWEYIRGNASTINTGFIVLEHDLFEQTVEIATGYVLPDALAFTPKLDIMPVAQCLNMPMADAYIETNDNKTHPPALAAATASGSGTIAPVNTLPATGSGAAQATGSGSSNSTSGKGNGAAGVAAPLGLASALVGALIGAGALFL